LTARISPSTSTNTSNASPRWHSLKRSTPPRPVTYLLTSAPALIRASVASCGDWNVAVMQSPSTGIAITLLGCCVGLGVGLGRHEAQRPRTGRSRGQVDFLPATLKRWVVVRGR